MVQKILMLINKKKIYDMYTSKLPSLISTTKNDVSKYFYTENVLGKVMKEFYVEIIIIDELKQN